MLGFILDFILVLLIIYNLIYYSYKAWQRHKYGSRSNRDIRRYYEKKFELDYKYRSKVPTHDKNGNPYFTVKQALDKVGVYSKEYHEELKKLKKELRG